MHVGNLTDSDAPVTEALNSMERIELLVDLTAAAWAMTGQPWPQLPRAQWPVRVRSIGDES